MILLISASQVARIIGMSHQCPGTKYVIIKNGTCVYNLAIYSTEVQNYFYICRNQVKITIEVITASWWILWPGFPKYNIENSFGHESVQIHFLC
jgi:hypothetical protein